MRSITRILLALLFVGSGVLHMARPRPYVRIMPIYLPAPELLVAVSGLAEILGGIGLLVPPTRRVAGMGLIALLVAVFPANVEMVAQRERAGGGIPAWALYGRLALQPALIGLVALAFTERRVAPRPR